MVAFLIAIAISVWMWSTYTAEVVKYAQPAEAQARQIAGYDDRGKPVMQSARMSPEEKDGKLQWMLVDSLQVGGAMETFFTLQAGDKIIAAGPFNFKEYEYDEEMAKALILGEYQKKGQITVLRNGKKMKLPVPTDGTAAALADANDSSSEGELTKDDTTKPKPVEQEKTVPKELGPLKGILR
jgi:hypothetical protein